MNGNAYNIDVDAIVDRVKQRKEKCDLAHAIAPDIELLELAITLGLAKWSALASQLGVHKVTMTRSKNRARELFDEWKKNGVFDKLNNAAGASNVSNVRRDNNGGVERLQSGSNVLQSLQSPIDDPAIIEERQKRLKFFEAFAKANGKR
ncbi:hypothetical protein [Tepidiphilus margaritifer]|uniref:hypothetical protein n=1 Tax=Tepidiphilus margaritifer TaxID=203471 RepID=UPI00048FAD69|nr:hypothetical protein [Tepidiphilus margaritifer]